MSPICWVTAEKICPSQIFVNIPNQMISIKSIWLIEYTKINYESLCKMTSISFLKPPHLPNPRFQNPAPLSQEQMKHDGDLVF